MDRLLLLFDYCRFFKKKFIILAKVSYVMLNRWFTDDYPMTPWCLKCHASVILCYNHAVK